MRFPYQNSKDWKSRADGDLYTYELSVPGEFILTHTLLVVSIKTCLFPNFQDHCFFHVPSVQSAPERIPVGDAHRTTLNEVAFVRKSQHEQMALDKRRFECSISIKVYRTLEMDAVVRVPGTVYARHLRVS